MHFFPCRCNCTLFHEIKMRMKIKWKYIYSFLYSEEWPACKAFFNFQLLASGDHPCHQGFQIKECSQHSSIRKYPSKKRGGILCLQVVGIRYNACPFIGVRSFALFRSRHHTPFIWTTYVWPDDFHLVLLWWVKPMNEGWTWWKCGATLSSRVILGTLYLWTPTPWGFSLYLEVQICGGLQRLLPFCNLSAKAQIYNSCLGKTKSRVWDPQCAILSFY
jgi:hypothetical protein